MPRARKNFSYFTYVDDNGDVWNVRGEDVGAFTGVDGHAAFTAGAPVWGRNTRRRHVRYVVAEDPGSFRTARGIIYTPAAFAAIAGGDAINVNVPGQDAAVVYNVSQKIPEAQPLPKASRHLAE